jgi:hypothetical protein
MDRMVTMRAVPYRGTPTTLGDNPVSRFREDSRDDPDHLDRIHKRGRHCWRGRVQQVKRPDLDANPDVTGHSIGTVLSGSAAPYRGTAHRSGAVDHCGAVHCWHNA